MSRFDRVYIGGVWTDPTSTETVEVINPATEKAIAAVAGCTVTDVDAAVAAARNAFEPWAATPVGERAAYLRAIARGLDERGEELAQLISAEMGSPIGFSRQVQVGLPTTTFSHAADVLERFEFERTDGATTIIREPIGVVGAITPWNYPLHQIAGKVAYALAAGNTTVVKPSLAAPLNAWVLAEVIDEIGLPAGVFNLVSGAGSVIGEAIADHPDVDMVSFTGSTRAGRRVAELAAGSIKRVALELGGKSAAIVLPDADLAAVIPLAVEAAMYNSGQTCSAHTRLLVPRDRLAKVEKLAVDAARALRPGDPTDETTVLGPLVSRSQLDQVRGYIARAIGEGALLLWGGGEPVADFDTGFYICPTILSDVTTDMEIHREEVFGPVLAIVTYDTEDDAVRIANDSVYGLSGGVWSADTANAQAVARRIRAGQVLVNGGSFSPDAPFGGYKQSGIGREFGTHGLEEFLEIKAVLQ